MAVGLDVIFVRGCALDIHIARIPVALFGNALCRPMRPYAELRVAIPVRVFVIFHERFPRRLERPGGDLASAGSCDERLWCGRNTAGPERRGQTGNASERGCFQE